jgi:choline dehydrogenase-like flavoprotein
VRCRGLGGSTLAWAGKSATFDEIDFEARSWIAHSGWALPRRELEPYFECAAGRLNLGPNCYDGSFWEESGQPPPDPALDAGDFTPFFWQFARSRLNPLSILRAGAEFEASGARDVRVLLNATATRLHTDELGSRFDRLEISSLCGRKAEVRAPVCVLAASAIENARLLLISDGTHAKGLGNRHGLAGRFLTDHVQAGIGSFGADAARSVAQRFGFYGLRRAGRSHMYSHGLALSPDRQRREHLLNGAVYFAEQRSADDPVSALGRLLRRQSRSPRGDLMALARSPGALMQAVGVKALESDRLPDGLRRMVVDNVVRRLPNMAARNYQFRGLPHKLDGAMATGIAEQAPDPENRITLSQTKDALGLPLPQVAWQAGAPARQTLLRMGQVLRQSFAAAGLPAPDLPEWISGNRPEDAVVIDMGHSAGTTRMSESPATGVVNADQRLHEVQGIYAAGGSVMPTPGHANPTLMMVAMSIRLAGHLKSLFAQKG